MIGVNKIICRFWLIPVIITAAFCQALTEGAAWRGHEIYLPEIERGYVIESTPDGLAYNHCPTVMWFNDRWFCAWNGNEVPVEGRPGLQIWMSTSIDGRAWSPPFSPFSRDDLCETPFRHLKAKQWQPEFIVVDNQLWCFFYETSGNKEDRGCYFARLSEPDGKWAIRRLLFDGSESLAFDGHSFNMIFPSQNPVQLRSGRVLVPVILAGGRSPDAPEKAQGFWSQYRRASVLYSDDLGETWHYSKGCTVEGRTFCPWEPTIWEQSDGSVLMVFRNNSHAVFLDDDKMPLPSQYLIGARSTDGGEKWGTTEYVPIETICSRMYVAPLDGKGIWNPVVPDDDYTGRLHLMLHNDVPGSSDWAGVRRNLALFFKRGDGFEFTAGPGFTGNEQRTVYPQHGIRDNMMLVTYCQSFAEKRSIRYARITPLPDPDKRYLLPRHDVKPSPRPTFKQAFMRFEGRQQVIAPDTPGSRTNRLALSAWVRWRDGEALLAFPERGLLWRIAAYGEERSPRLLFQSGLIRPSQVSSKLPVLQDEWVYVGFDLDAGSGKGVFYINDQTEAVTVKAVPKRAMLSGDAYIGWAGAGRRAFYGDVRFVALHDSPLGAAGHRALYDRFAASVGRQPLGQGAANTDAKTLLWMDAADPDLTKTFQLPDVTFQGVRTEMCDGMQMLRFYGEGSAGVDLDENRRERGDIVDIRFRFKTESGDGQVVCTTGDADQPARLLCWDGKLLLKAGSQERFCGDAPQGEWLDIQISTFADKTRAQLANNPAVEVRHCPRGTWIYLGQGYRTGTLTPEDRFVIDAASVRSRVERAASKQPLPDTGNTNVLHAPDFSTDSGGYRASGREIELSASGAPDTVAGVSLKISADGSSGRVTSPVFLMPPSARSTRAVKGRDLAFISVRYALAANLTQGMCRVSLRVLDPQNPYAIGFEHFGGTIIVKDGVTHIHKPLCAIVTAHPHKRTEPGEGLVELVLSLEDARGEILLSNVRIDTAESGGPGFTDREWDEFEAAAGIRHIGVAGNMFQPEYAPKAEGGFVTPEIMDTAHKLFRTAGFNMARVFTYWNDHNAHYPSNQHQVVIWNSDPLNGTGDYAESLDNLRVGIDNLSYYGLGAHLCLRGSPDYTHPRHQNNHATSVRNGAEHLINYGDNHLSDPYPTPPYMRNRHWLYPPDDWQAWRRFAAQLASKLKGRRMVYEIMNEIDMPDQDALVGGYKAYALWLKYFYETVKPIDPEAVVLHADAGKMLPALIAEGALKHADGVAFHLYSGQLDTVRAMVQSSGAKKPLYMSEYMRMHPPYDPNMRLRDKVRQQVLWNAFSTLDFRHFSKILFLADSVGEPVYSDRLPGEGDRICRTENFVDWGAYNGVLSPDDLAGKRGDRIMAEVLCEPEMNYGGSMTVVLRATNLSDKPFHDVRLWPVGFVENLGFDLTALRAADINSDIFLPGHQREISLTVTPRETRRKAAGTYDVGLAVVNREGLHSLAILPLTVNP